MKRVIPLFFAAVLCLPAAAQSEQSAQDRLLRGLGLTESQIGQVLNVQSSTRDDVRQKRAQLRVVRAQINLAMIAPTVDLQRVDSLIDQASALRADIAKTLAAAEVRLRQIVGDSTFSLIKERLRARLRTLRELRFGGRGASPRDGRLGRPLVPDGVLQ